MVLLSGAVSSAIPGLLRDRPFRRYWAASSVSMLGDGLTSLAIPLMAAVVMHADALQMGVLNAAALAPSLCSLHLGALADRSGRRRTLMIATDLCAFALLVSLPLCHLLGVLTLCAVVCALGLCSALFTVCDGTLFVSLVDRARYVEGQSLLHGSQSVAALAGPGVAGLLVQALSAPLTVLADAASFLVSAVTLAPHPRRRARAGTRRGRVRGRGHALHPARHLRRYRARGRGHRQPLHHP
jgi:MFS family permease